MTFTLVALWVAVALLIVVGIAGTVLPALPGTILVFTGVLLGAWIDDFQRVGTTTVAIIGGLTVLAWVTDFVAGLLGAKRVGASREAIFGAAIGTVAGLFFGLFGLIFLPLVGAAIGEFISKSDLRRAGNVGIATWLGMLVGAVAKVVITFASVGIFVFALIF